ncbi:hypothetical protein Hanom_Chr12g01086771 [Helianthus anomalus]
MASFSISYSTFIFEYLLKRIHTHTCTSTLPPYITSVDIVLRVPNKPYTI